MLAQTSTLQSIIGYAFMTVVMFYGFVMIVGGKSLANKFLAWLMRNLVWNPLGALGNVAKAQLRRLLRWTGQQIRRGIRAAWIKLTT